MRKNILLADVDTEVLQAYRQALGEQWQVSIVSSGSAALAELEKASFDVLVAGLDLPELNGAELLERAGKNHPRVIRFVLAPETEHERVLRDVHGAHQFLHKPCEPSSFKDAIDRAVALDVWISNSSMRELVSRVRTFPPIPSLYVEILNALRSPSATTEQVGGIIARDMAMMTKLLQVLNSATFGLRRKITDPVEAVGILGFETVKSMVMTIKLLNQYDKVKPVYFSIERLWRHSTEAARIAKQITLFHTNDAAQAEAAFTAGLMHDIGKIVLAANFDEQYRGVQSLARKQQIPLAEAEKEVFGANHGEIGAYLLGLWGMPLDLLESAALHHNPSRSIKKEFTSLTAVHVANVLEHEINPDPEAPVPPVIDGDYLATIGVIDQLSYWRAAIAKRDTSNPAAPADKTKSTETIVAKRPAPSVPKPQPQPSPAVIAKRESLKRLGRYEWSVPIGVACLLVLATWLTVTYLSHLGASPAQPGQTKTTVKASQPVAVERQTGSFAPTPVASTAATAIPLPQSAEVTPANSTSLGSTERASTVASTPNATAVVPSAVAKSSEPKLQAIFFETGNPSAIVSGKLVHLNDQFAGARVASIDKSSVVLDSPAGRKVLTLKQ